MTPRNIVFSISVLTEGLQVLVTLYSISCYMFMMLPGVVTH